MQTSWRVPEFMCKCGPEEITIRGDLSFVRGSILLSQGIGGEATQTELRYLEIYERAHDGTWKVIWGMDGPVQE